MGKENNSNNYLLRYHSSNQQCLSKLENKSPFTYSILVEIFKKTGKEENPYGKTISYQDYQSIIQKKINKKKRSSGSSPSKSNIQKTLGRFLTFENQTVIIRKRFREFNKKNNSKSLIYSESEPEFTDPMSSEDQKSDSIYSDENQQTFFKGTTQNKTNGKKNKKRLLNFDEHDVKECDFSLFMKHYEKGDREVLIKKRYKL